MFELLTVIVFVMLLVKAIGLTLKLTWGVAKVVASLLMGIALPLLVICFLFVGGVALVIPVIVIGIAVAILKVCV